MEIRKTVWVVIINDAGEILLATRKNGTFKNKRIFVGGGIRLGETPAQAAVREAREEIGLDIVAEEEVCSFQAEATGSGKQKHEMYVVLASTSHIGAISAALDADVTDPQFFAKDRLPWDMLTPKTTMVLRKHILPAE